MAASSAPLHCPSTVDTENVQASYNAGVLKLELNKKPEAQPKQIKVNVGGQRQAGEQEGRAGTGGRTVRNQLFAVGFQLLADFGGRPAAMNV